MAKRKRIGLIFSYNENWIAGAYYILNIVHALKTVKDDKKPIIIILSESINNFDKVVMETAYPYLEYVVFPFPKLQYSLVERIVNKLSRTILRRNIFVKKRQYPKLDFLYPNQIQGLSQNLKKVNWIPDFQEDYLPRFFSKEEIVRRKNHQRNVVANGDIVVLSSENAKSDFIRLYLNAKAKPFVLHFAVTHPDFSDQNLDTLLKKYNLPEHYFFAPNQFWAHKNHMVILKAVKALKEQGQNVVVAMSGKEDDYRNVDNFKTLKDFVKQHALKNNINFLGFIPRKEQLCLFANAIAIIQPSLFEGWSTVVEDAKALGKYIILSNLEVHEEQIQENVSFFDPENHLQLAKHIELYLSDTPQNISINYKKNINEFGKKFFDLVLLASE